MCLMHGQIYDYKMFGTKPYPGCGIVKSHYTLIPVHVPPMLCNIMHAMPHFQDCGEYTGCLLEPSSCTPGVDCVHECYWLPGRALTDGSQTPTYVDFKLSGKPADVQNGYVAVGLSTDTRMVGNLLSCLFIGQNQYFQPSRQSIKNMNRKY